MEIAALLPIGNMVLSPELSWPVTASGVVATGQKRSVNNVHTFRPGLARTAIGLARIPYVSATSQSSQSLESRSSPTSGTAYPLVRGVFALTSLHSRWSGPSDSGRGVCLAPRVTCEVMGERVQGRGWLALRFL